ncbi:putative PEP-CTERM system TPR-repeat lipoprotein [Pseudomonas sp. 58 R 12]|nr:putative PEP-CTERM system TPR-repeat lipoprotein [Pseudomonas sp. 58 R 12]
MVISSLLKAQTTSLTAFSAFRALRITSAIARSPKLTPNALVLSRWQRIRDLSSVRREASCGQYLTERNKPGPQVFILRQARPATSRKKMQKLKIALIICLCLAVLGCDKIQDALKTNEHKNEIKNKFAQSQELQDLGNNTAAIANFKKIEADPAATNQQKASALRYISLSYYEAGDYQSSGEYAAKAAAYYPVNSYFYLVNMADADLMQGRVPSARDRLEQAVKIDPHQLSANNVLGLLYMGDNGKQYTDFKKALEFNQAAFDIAPGRVTQIVLVRNLIKLEQYSKAKINLDELKLKYPNDARLRSLQSELDTAKTVSKNHQ